MDRRGEYERKLALSPQARAADYSLLTDEERAELERRRRIVLDIEAVGRPSEDQVRKAAADFGIGVRQFNRYRADFRVTQDILCLARGQSDGGRGGLRLNPQVEKLIEDVRLEFDRDRPNTKEHHIAKEIRHRCITRGLSAPSPKTLRSRFAGVPIRQRVAAKYGSKWARERYDPLRGKTPPTNFPLERVQIDHTLVDVVCTGDHDRQHLGRPWVTIAIDEYSRAILAFVLSWEYPNATTIALLMARILTPKEEWLKSTGTTVEWPMWGKPSVIYVDNARELSSNAVVFGCNANSMSPPERRPAGRPHFGGIIERFMGNAMDKMRLLRGSTADQRGFGKERTRDPNETAEMSRSDLELWLLEQICEQYHHTAHSGNRMQTPYKAWHRGIYGTEKAPGIGMPPVPPDKRKIFLDFAELQHRTIQRYGIRWDALYWDEILRPFLDSGTKKRFIVKRNPYDMSRIWFLHPDEGRYYEIPAADLTLRSIALWEWRQAKARERVEGDPTDESRVAGSVERQRALEVQARNKTGAHKRRMNQQRRADAKAVGQELGLTELTPVHTQRETNTPAGNTMPRSPQRRGGTFGVVTRE
ncbi:Mu transposase C-terminal domain-containing protein [Caulobacter radicis]|uniref:Integrase catalytic subunit n=1 Tax=Caulobacter radicis TaxID=2172650 RepID=A0A2T9JN52_9CAUL|nr:Mu transposase C-terminal domain-containing protein [Caulobacter radicis]PVM85130.1 integrase catalytic subunit [Caulobacter radicis]